MDRILSFNTTKTNTYVRAVIVTSDDTMQFSDVRRFG